MAKKPEILKHRWLVPLALMLLAAAPAPDFSAQLAGPAKLLDAGHPAEALVPLDALLAAAELPVERGQVQALRSFALAQLQRIPEAHQAIEAAAASIESPSMTVLRQLFLLRAFDGDVPGAADTVLLIAASDAKALETLPTPVLVEVMRSLHKDDGRAFDVDYALDAAGWQPADATLGEIDGLRLRLIMGLLRRDRLDDAGPVVARLISPASLARIGIDRRFQPLWPAIEARLGPGADIADAAFVGATKARFDAAPTSLIARLGYAEALNIASREPEALAVLDVARTPAELAALGDREVWLVNLQAALLGDAGQIDAALARYAALNTTPVAGRAAMAATMINHALFALSVDRPKEALAAADFADANGAAGNDFGRAYLAQARSCALTLLGKPADAAAQAAPVLAHPEVNADAALAVMICLGQRDAAAALIIRQLGDPDERMDMLFELQPFLIADRAGARDVRQRAALRQLKQRGDVKAAFLKAGRDLPAAVAPPR